MDSQPLIHHQSTRCSARGPVLSDTNWEQVTCPDCKTKRQQVSRRNKIFLGATVLVVLVVACIGAVANNSGSSSSSTTPAARQAAATTVTAATPLPTISAPTPVDLSATESANLWVLLSNGDYGLVVYADPVFDVDEYALSVFVDGIDYCNTRPIYADEGVRELGCASLEYGHTAVTQVSAQVRGLGGLRCEKNVQSQPHATAFACAWR